MLKRHGRNLRAAVVVSDPQLVAGFSTADHFSLSLFTSAASAACVRASGLGMSDPRSSRRLRTFSSSNALPAAAFSLARIGAGVPFGAKIAFQAEAWYFGKPASAVVGKSGSDGLRSGVAIA